MNKKAILSVVGLLAVVLVFIVFYSAEAKKGGKPVQSPSPSQIVITTPLVSVNPEDPRQPIEIPPSPSPDLI